MSTISQGEYQQVVFLGDALDTRPFRLLWPRGTLFFLVAPADDHAQAEAVLKAQGVRAPPGCLLRRVNADLGAASVDSRSPLFLPQLEHAGFQSTNLSVWAIQGLDGHQLSPSSTHALLTEVANASAHSSLLMGELPGLGREEAENMLAEVGLISTVLPHGEMGVGYGSWDEGLERWQRAHEELSKRWLFTAQQTRLSVAQMELYAAHTAHAMEIDEDFEGNFS